MATLLNDTEPIKMLDKIIDEVEIIKLDAEEMLYLAAERRFHELGNKKIQLDFKFRTGVVKIIAFVYENDFCIAHLESHPPRIGNANSALSIIREKLNNMNIVAVNATEEAIPFLNTMVQKRKINSWRFT